MLVNHQWSLVAPDSAPLVGEDVVLGGLAPDEELVAIEDAAFADRRRDARDIAQRLFERGDAALLQDLCGNRGDNLRRVDNRRPQCGQSEALLAVLRAVDPNDVGDAEFLNALIRSKGGGGPHNHRRRERRGPDDG